ncbi:MATE family efflux transporter [Porphyromonadaceae bacterium W3.11]|nr:MATE family efflux transporter [Porphyromonadaceae bacterium W3.11]
MQKLFKRRDNNRGENKTITAHDLGVLSVPLLLKYYAVPSLVGSLVNSLYNIIDRIFIGQGVSSLAISGLAVTFPILIFLQAFGVLIGAGASARISILLGQKRQDEAERLLGNAFVLTILTSLTLIITMMIFLDDLLLSFGASQDTLPYAKEYLQIVIPANIFANLTYSYSAIMRSTGYPRKAMTAMIIGAGMNIILDPLFIFVFKMGIQGIGWATMISMFVSAVYVMSHFMDKRSLITIKVKNFKLHKRHIIGIISIGVAPFAIQITASIVNLFKNTSLISYGGDYAVGAYGIVNSIATLIVMTMMGLSFAMQPIVGYNYGAGKMSRVKEAYYTTRRINMLIGLVGSLLALFIPRLLAKMFTFDHQMLDVAERAIRIELIALWAVGFQISTGQFFQSIGSAWRALVISLSRQVFYLIPLIYILPRLGFGLDGIWAASPISDILSLITAYIMITQFKKLMSKKEVDFLDTSN